MFELWTLESALPELHSSGMQSFRSALLILLAAAALYAGGCSAFNRDWKQAAGQPAAGALEGRWEGSWRSDVNGHTDRLRCLITRQAKDSFEARFHAKYRKVFSFSYTVPLQAEPTDGAFHFSGEADLGRLAGGVYHYKGHAEGTNFFSTYSCKYDHGTFQMRRPVVTGP
jgi:hypothetical protein